MNKEKEQEKKEPKKVIKSKDELFTELLMQNTYTDMVEITLKYLKFIKGAPSDLVTLLGYLGQELVSNAEKIDAASLEEELSSSQAMINSSTGRDGRGGSKLRKLMIVYNTNHRNEMLV
jgi:hypothetical protein